MDANDQSFWQDFLMELFGPKRSMVVVSVQHWHGNKQHKQMVNWQLFQKQNSC